jgi:hypothetical protein
MPEALAPIDTSVSVPPSVKAAAEAAEALHRAAYGGEPEPETPSNGGDTLQLTPDPAPEAPPQTPPEAPHIQPERREIPETGETGSWEHRYLAMKGRFDQSQFSLGQMQEQMSQLGEELMRTQQALQFARRGAGSRQPPPQQRPNGPPPTVTPQDIETYGPELIDLVTRAGARRGGTGSQSGGAAGAPDLAAGAVDRAPAHGG